jgi:hypothetical protein
VCGKTLIPPGGKRAKLEADRKETEMREVFVVALVLICPLMMIWMMRGHGHGHGHSHGAAGREDHENGHQHTSTDELRRQRAELDREIDEREHYDRDEQYGPGTSTSRSG